jgi:hypothetical protein
MIDNKHLISVGRYNFKKDWTIGRFYINSKLTGFSVEDEMRQVKVKGETAIPFGSYDLGFRQSPKFSAQFLYSDSNKLLIEARERSKYKTITDWRNHDLVWVKNVPNFELILWHWGNDDDDTEGCLITGGGLGVFAGQEGVAGSRNFYKKHYPKIYEAVKAGNQKILYFNENIVV